MNQSDLLQNILAMDQQAQALTEDAKAQSQNIDASIESEIEALRTRYETNAAHYLSRLEESEEKRCSRQLQALDERNAERLRQMEKIYQAEQEQWAQTIFERIIGKAES